MSVIIRGVRWPTSCKDCFFCRIFAFDPNHLPEPRCLIKGEEIPRQGKLLFCPLVEIPTPHGRLIDASELIKSYMKGTKAGIDDFYDTIDIIDNAPTILEVEE